MKKSYWLFILTLVIGLIFVEYDLTKRMHNKSNPIAFDRNAKLNLTKIPRSPNHNRALSASSDLNNFDQKFNQVSNELTQLQSHPEETEKKLQELAGTMSVDDVKKMSRVMSDVDQNGDQRAMAVELLARKQTIESLKQLESFVQQHQNTTKWSRSREFESVLRAQAIEGIAAFPQKDLAMSSLMALDPKMDEAFLKDRIKRSIVGLKNENQIPEKVDNDALIKLVE